MKNITKKDEFTAKIVREVEEEVTLTEAKQAVENRLRRIAEVQANLDYENAHLVKEQAVVTELENLGIVDKQAEEA